MTGFDDPLVEWHRLFAELFGTSLLVLVACGGSVVGALSPGSISRPAALAKFSHSWIYLVGPLAGAVIAVGFAWILRGPGGDVGGVTAARGRLG
jgi:aquaporin Z